MDECHCYQKVTKYNIFVLILNKIYSVLEM